MDSFRRYSRSQKSGYGVCCGCFAHVNQFVRNNWLDLKILTAFRWRIEVSLKKICSSTKQNLFINVSLKEMKKKWKAFNSRNSCFHFFICYWLIISSFDTCFNDCYMTNLYVSIIRHKYEFNHTNEGIIFPEIFEIWQRVSATDCIPARMRNSRGARSCLTGNVENPVEAFPTDFPRVSVAWFERILEVVRS